MARHFVVVGGIPDVIYDAVWSESRTKLLGDAADLISAPLRPSGYDRKYRYTVSHANSLLKDLVSGVQTYAAADMTAEFYILLIYVVYNDDTTAAFLKRFFPLTLNWPVDLGPPGITNAENNTRKNRLIEFIRKAADEMREAAKLVRHELTSRRNTTPLLLPLRNFQSDVLAPLLMEASHRLCQETKARIDEARQNFERRHLAREAGKDFFADRRGLGFKSPGRYLHGVPVLGAEGSAHNSICFLAGRARLGASFYASFHYDCSYVKGTVTGAFPNCHDGSEGYKNLDYLNIAPNDFTRG